MGMKKVLNRGQFIEAGFSCSPGINGGWSVESETCAGQALFTSFEQMCDWLEDQHEGLVIGEMAKKHPMQEVGPAEGPAVSDMPVGPYAAGMGSLGSIVRAQEEVMAGVEERSGTAYDFYGKPMGPAGEGVQWGSVTATVVRPCGYINCTAENPWSGCEIHNPEASDV